MPNEKHKTGKLQEEKVFEVNYRKLELLSQELQNDRVSIDELVPRIKEALSAIKVCKDVLQETKSQLVKIDAEFAELAKVGSSLVED